VTYKPLHYGDFVVTSDMKRGFVTHYRSSGSVSVLLVDEKGPKIETWPSALLDPSGVRPTDEECAAWARWALK
jgi:hypothetical protein